MTGFGSLYQDLLASAYPSRWLATRGIILDPWQAEVADSPETLQMLCCSRQSGKTTLIAGLVAWCLQEIPNALVLVLAPSERQSQELLPTARGFLDWDVVAPTSLAKKTLELTNGSRAFALPGSEETVRGFSAPTLIVIDEAGMASDLLYYAVRQMIATVSKTAKIVLLSTPKGQRGFFYEEWFGDLPAKRTKVTVYDCPRITPEFIAAEKERYPDWLFRQEYMCEFVDNNLQVFGTDYINGAIERGAALLPLALNAAMTIPENGSKVLQL